MKRLLIHTSKLPVTLLIPALFSFQISGCGGDYSGNTSSGESRAATPETETTSGTPDVVSTPSATIAPGTLEAFFTTRIEPHMNYCGTCHTPGSIADTDEGRGFLLQNGISHYDSFQQAWDTLGKGVTGNALLRENIE